MIEQFITELMNNAGLIILRQTMILNILDMLTIVRHEGVSK